MTSRVLGALLAWPLCAALLTASAQAGDFERGIVEYQKENFGTASRLFLRAARDGNPAAQELLGRMYLAGQGVDKDPSTALKWFKKSARSGLASSQYLTGVLNATGTGTEQDYEEAVRWYQKW